MDLKRARAAVLPLVVCFMVTGCANVRLYNPADDAVAKKASDAVVAADLKSALVPERAAMQELSKREQEAVKRDQYALRDRKVAAILSATSEKFGWDFLADEMSNRIKALAGSVEASRAVETALLKRDDAAAKLPPLRQNYLIVTRGRVGLSCPIGTAQRPAAGSELEQAIKSYESACNVYQVAIADLFKSMGAGELAELTRRMAEIEAGRVSYEAELEKAKAAYQEALAKSQAVGDPTSKNSNLTTLKSRFDELGTLAKPRVLLENKVLAKLTDSGKLEKVKVEIKAIENLIQAFDGELPASGTTSAQERLAALRNLADALAAPVRAPLTALILQAEHLRLEASGIERHVSRAKERIALLRKKQASMIDELLFLNSAQRAMSDFAGAKCQKSPALYDSFLSKKPNCRFLLAQALSDYVNANTFGKAEQESIDYQLIAQGHEAALDDSETALAQTDNLMRLPVSQLAQAYSGGFRPEEISNLVNALGLGAIAVRVK